MTDVRSWVDYQRSSNDWLGTAKNFAKAENFEAAAACALIGLLVAAVDK